MKNKTNTLAWVFILGIILNLAMSSALVVEYKKVSADIITAETIYAKEIILKSGKKSEFGHEATLIMNANRILFLEPEFANPCLEIEYWGFNKPSCESP